MLTPTAVCLTYAAIVLANMHALCTLYALCVVPSKIYLCRHRQAVVGSQVGTAGQVEDTGQTALPSGELQQPYAARFAAQGSECLEPGAVVALLLHAVQP